MKRVEPQSIKNIIDQALKASNLDTTVREHRAAYLWAEVLGPAVNRHTGRRYVADGVLHVYIDSGPLKNELAFNRARIIKAINDMLSEPTIHDLIIH